MQTLNDPNIPVGQVSNDLMFVFEDGTEVLIQGWDDVQYFEYWNPGEEHCIPCLLGRPQDNPFVQCEVVARNWYIKDGCLFLEITLKWGDEGGTSKLTANLLKVLSPE